MYKNFIKKNIALMMVFILLFSFAAPIVVEATNDSSINANVRLRIESYDRTIAGPINVNIKSLDLSEYPGINKSAEEYDSLKPVHAIVKGLEESGIDPKDPDKFDIGYSGNYIRMIDGLKEFDKGPNSGWMYFVDNQYANSGVGDFEIKDGQEVVMFYVTNYMDYEYSWFEKQSLTVEEDEEFTLKLNGSKGGFGIEPVENVENAVILVNDEEYSQDGELVKTNGKGEATLKLEKAGTYHISAKYGEGIDRQLIRPYASIRVNEAVKEINRIKSIGEIEDITVDYGTEKDDLISLLPKTVKITDTNEDKHDVNLSWEISDYKNDRTGIYSAVGRFELPNGVYQSEPETKLEVKTNIQVKDKIVSDSVDLQEALDKTLKFYDENRPTDADGEWEAFVGLWGAGVDLKDRDYKWKTNDPGFKETIYSNEHIRYIFSLLGTGEDPSNIWGNRNLFKELSGHLKEYNNEFGTIGKHIFAIKALDIGEALGADVGDWNEETKEIAIKTLLKEQNDDGSFYVFSKLDHTGWALMSLSEYRHIEGVDEAIDKALEYIEKAQNENGSFVESAGWGTGENSNTNACVIQGLVAVGEDVTDPNGRWAKNGNTAIDGLLKFQQEDGSFWWEEKNEGNIVMATKQSLVALVDTLNGVSTWDRMETEIYLSSVGEKEVEELNNMIVKLPKLEDLSLDDKDKVNAAYNLFMRLPEEYKEKVEKQDLLKSLKAEINKMEKEVEDINDAIWELPGEVDKITLEHKSAILEIIERYNNLKDANKKYVEYYNEVLEAYAKILELEEDNENTGKDEKPNEDIKPGEDNNSNGDKDDTGSGEDNNLPNDGNTDGNNIGSNNGENDNLDGNPKTGDKGIMIPLLFFILSSSILIGLGLNRKKSNSRID